MPSGFTEILEDRDDVTFREFAIRCARGMGVCYSQRDESLKHPPRVPEHDAHYEEILVKTKIRLVELRGLSSEGAQALWESECASHAKANEGFRIKWERTKKVYGEMRLKIEAWTPPTPEHERFKAFMLEQVDQELVYLGKRPYQYTDAGSAAAWLKLEIENAEENVAYYEKQVARVLASEAESRQWLEELFRSLPAEEK